MPSMPQSNAGKGSPERHEDVCMCVAATGAFWVGAVVAIGSFLATHPRFGGAIVLFHDGLPAAHQRFLRAAFRSIQLRRVTLELQQRCEVLAQAFPHWRGRLARFYALEAFRLEGYRKVLFCDADLLFVAPIDEMLQAAAELACCSDRAGIAGAVRDAATFLPLDKADAATGAVIEHPFNSGLLAIDGAICGPACYADLLALATPETWRDAREELLDQMVLNRYFSGRQTLFDSTYNYLLRSAAELKARHGLGLDDARVLHFNIACKPWMLDAWLPWSLGQPAESLLLVPAFKRWLAAYHNCASTAMLRMVGQRRTETAAAALQLRDAAGRAP